MGSLQACDGRARDAVEVLLRRIVDRALLGSLVTGAALGGACSDGDGNGQSMDPSTGIDSGGFLIPEPITPRDAALDARAEVVLDATVDAPIAPLDAGHDASEFPLGAFDPCQGGAGFPVRAAKLTLIEPADYVSVRVATGFQGAPDADVTWTSDEFTILDEEGSACRSATNDACTQKIAHHPDWLEQSYCVQACDEWSVVTTRGDDVERWATPPELLALLGQIDSDADALMLAASHGYDVTCPAPGDSSEGASLRYVLQVPEGRELIGVRYQSTCPVVIRRSRLLVTIAGDVRERDSADFPRADTGCVGRVPEGLRPVRVGAGLAGFLARCAHLEAASVFAFRRLAEELRAHGAPAELVARALDAAGDEVRHAAVVAALARAHGAEVEEARVEVLPLRQLVVIARENAVEGCVRETYGALVGAWQAARAEDLALRAAMGPIAQDEARHAQLSHDVHAWLMTQLSPAERAHVNAAKREAIAALWGEQPPAYSEAGLPDAHAARTLLGELERGLWAA